VQGHETFVGKIMEEGMRQQIDVKMDDIEIIGAAPNLAQHSEGAAQMVANPGKP
jgi:hypothetical protein